MAAVEAFYQTVPRFNRLEEVADDRLYRPLPGDWVLGVTDVVSSTEAIRAGRYKDVNLAGAAAIPAVANALGSFHFPYVFGGDGVALALPGEQAGLLREALGETSAFVRDALSLELRAAVLPVADIRAAGHEVKLARFARSPHVDYAMFAGGGVSFAVERMKAGEFGLAPAASGMKPDLEGLSCRWHPMPAKKGVVLSLIVMPVAGATGFDAVLSAIFRLIADGDGVAPVLTDERLRLPYPWRGVVFEARAARRPDETLAGALFRLIKAHLISFVLFRTGMKAGRFDPGRYRRELVDNADSAKFEDGLRMTIDCTLAVADALESLLATAEAAGSIQFGTHRQDAAIMTCLVPVVDEADHAHFIDGASGGYATAAAAMKAKLKG